MSKSVVELSVAGDRLRVLLRSANTDASDAPTPLVVVYGTDGDCTNLELTAVLDELSPWCTAAAPDLPLCGPRASDKLTAAAYDPEHGLSDALLGDVHLQLQDDLRVLIEELTETRAIDRERTAVVAWGRGALAFRSFDPATCGLTRVDCLENPSTDTARIDCCKALRSALLG